MILFRGGSRTTSTYTKGRFVIIVKRSVQDVAAVLDPPLLLFLLECKLSKFTFEVVFYIINAWILLQKVFR